MAIKLNLIHEQHQELESKLILVQDENEKQKILDEIQEVLSYLETAKTYNRDYGREWSRRNTDKLQEYYKKGYPKARERILAYSKEYQKKNRVENLILAQKSRNKRMQNPNYRAARNEVRRKYFQKRKADVLWNMERKLRNNLRNGIWQGLKFQGLRKNSHTETFVGCAFEFLINYLEQKFQKGMTWDNYGKKGWHVDHIIPVAAFDLTDIEQQKACFHYSNLQPLWETDNERKQDILPNGERAKSYPKGIGMEFINQAFTNS